MKKIIYKPTVPEFVSVWIEKQDGLDAIHIAVVKALESKNEQLVGWVFENQDEFALAYAFRHKVAKKDEQKELIKIARINKEEYEVLKEVDERYEWIARDKDRSLYAFTKKPVRKYDPSPYWGTETVEPYSALDLYGEIHLFQFIQWEDEKPYEISELIEEYEEHGFVKINQAGRERLNKLYGNESEETEVKKDLDWVIQEIHTTRKVLADSESSGNETADEFTFNNGKEAGLVDVLKLLDQLDEPEVLTQEWIEDNEYRVIEYPESVVPSKKLQNLLVPKQEELEVKIQELIETYKQEDGAYSNPENGWIGGFIEDLKSLLEEEQKYIVSDNSSIPLLIKNDSGKIMSYDSQIAYNNSNGTIELTEQEIKDYDPRYMAFAKPVEEME